MVSCTYIESFLNESRVVRIEESRGRDEKEEEEEEEEEALLIRDIIDTRHY